MTFLGQTCVIASRTAGTTLDAYGNSLAGTTLGTVSCEIQQVRRSEPGEQGEFSVTEWTGFFPSGTVVDTSDLVTESSLGTFEVIGDPWDANLGSAAVNHVETSLKKAA